MFNGNTLTGHLMGELDSFAKDWLQSHIISFDIFRRVLSTEFRSKASQHIFLFSGTYQRDLMLESAPHFDNIKRSRVKSTILRFDTASHNSKTNVLKIRRRAKSNMTEILRNSFREKFACVVLSILTSAPSLWSCSTLHRSVMVKKPFWLTIFWIEFAPNKVINSLRN